MSADGRSGSSANRGIPSVRLTLLKWLIFPMLSVNLIAAALMYCLAWVPAQVAFDQSLADAAWALIPHLHFAGGRIQTNLSSQAEQILRVDHFDKIYLVVRDASGKTIVGDRNFPVFAVPRHLDEPYAYDAAMDGEAVRMISLKTVIDGHPVTIGAAETLRKRKLVRENIFSALLSIESILFSLSIGIVWFAVWKGLFPMQAIQDKLKVRQDNDFSPIKDADVPVEVREFVNAINLLLHKAQTAAKAQQDFLANAAHQLRTPLAGLKAQLEWLQQKYAWEKETLHSANLMMASIERMIRQANQLLALARAEASHFESGRLEPVELNKLVEEAVQHFVREADEKGIDLGFELQQTTILGDRFLLRDLIDNLIDNAIRYSPRKGVVTVHCMQDALHGTIIVEDSGPGISPQARERIFDRFYRVEESVCGSGLGLAIVRDIAKLHNASVGLDIAQSGTGTIFYVKFPSYMISPVAGPPAEQSLPAIALREDEAAL